MRAVLPAPFQVMAKTIRGMTKSVDPFQGWAWKPKWVMMTLNRSCDPSPYMELNKNNSHKDMINRARLRIREALESNLTIQEIADELSMSYSNFRKLFKEYTGLSPAVYQQDLKLQRAKELLSTTDLSVKEIAYRLNFDSPDYFSAKFKIKTGRKPSEMRRK